MGDHRAGRPARLGVVVALVAIAVGAITWIAFSVAHKQDAEKHAAVAQANGIADPIVALCQSGGDAARVLSTAKTPDGQTVCGAAAGVKSAPRDDTSDGLTVDQVQGLVQQELAKRPTPQPVAPTQAQIAAAVQAFIAANPTMFKAPAPTSAQIQAAVTAYMRAHPAPAPQPEPYVNPAYPLPDYEPVPGLGGYPGWPQSGWPQRGPRAAR
jgi:hypothetical protein